jgi:multiple sugar transport system permease protein
MIRHSSWIHRRDRRGVWFGGTTFTGVNSGDANLYPMLMMGGLVTIVPLIALFLLLQRYWRSGMLLGGIAN